MKRNMQIPDDDNPFQLMPWDVPVGTIYRWFRAFDGSSEDEDRLIRLTLSGWHPVLASQHDGRWTPPGFKGPIQLYGMILMERALRIH